MNSDSPPVTTPAHSHTPSQQEEKNDDSSTETLKIVQESKGQIYIDWNLNDVQHPFNWSLQRRWIITFVALLYNLLLVSNATGYAAGVEHGSTELHTSRFMWLIGMPCIMIPIAVFALALAPMSEAYGRRPLYIIGMLGYG